MAAENKSELRQGIIEFNDKGAGYLRDLKNGYQPRPGDPYISPKQIKALRLQEGQELTAEVQPGRRGGLLVRRINEVSGLDPREAAELTPFKHLTSISPERRIKLETDDGPVSTRVIDLVTPIGCGTRGLIVAAPRTGKTTLIKQIAAAVTKNHPEIKLMAVGIDERPEEATDLRRSIKGEVMTSSLDHSPEEHRRLANFITAIARARVEAGKDVLILLDSLTRLARAFNSAGGSRGRTMSGGLDSQAMEIPRRIFGSARQTEEAGSLTIIATCLVDTGSRMDELIFQEFKGTGNMELVLDRQLADLRIWPAVNIAESGTRREELLQTEDECRAAALTRRSLAELRPNQATEKLIETLAKYDNNQAFIDTVLKTAG